MATRSEDVAAAYLLVARADHYMVGIVEAVTDDELAAAEQLLITGENAAWTGRADHKRHLLALNMVEAEQKRRLQAASAGTATRPELDAWQAGIADHDSACAADEAPYGLDAINLDCMSPEDLADVQRALALLAQYAEVKRNAMVARLAGKMATALTLEAQCEGMYSRLPANWRW